MGTGGGVVVAVVARARRRIIRIRGSLIHGGGAVLTGASDGGMVVMVTKSSITSGKRVFGMFLFLVLSGSVRCSLVSRGGNSCGLVSIDRVGGSSEARVAVDAIVHT